MVLHGACLCVLSPHNLNITKKVSHLELFNCFDSFRDGLQIALFFLYWGVWETCVIMMLFPIHLCVNVFEVLRVIGCERAAGLKWSLASKSLPLHDPLKSSKFVYVCIFQIQLWNLDSESLPHGLPHDLLLVSYPITALLAPLSLWQWSTQAALLPVCHVPNTNVAGETWALLVFKYRLEENSKPQSCVSDVASLYGLAEASAFIKYEWVYCTQHSYLQTVPTTLLNNIIILNF